MKNSHILYSFKELAKLLLRALSNRFFINYSIVPVKSSQLVKSACFKVQPKDDISIAIVIQGNINHKADFTLETIKIYKKLYPFAHIILSTWSDAEGFANLIEDIGAHLIISPLPVEGGIGNINYQIISTKAGIQKAKSLCATHILKTRTDQRIYHPDAFTYLLSLIDAFPLFNVDLNIASQRIIGLSKNTFKHRIFGLSDMFLFGNTSDIERYWDISLFSNPKIAPPSAKTWYDQYVHPIPEVILFSNYLEKIGVELEPTMAGTASAYRRFFIICNYQDLGLYWHKYSWNADWHSDFCHDRYEISFLDWLLIYNSFYSYPEWFTQNVISSSRTLIPL